MKKTHGWRWRRKLLVCIVESGKETDLTMTHIRSLEQEARSMRYRNITKVPTFLIEGEKYDGGLEADLLLDAICQKLETKPPICVESIFKKLKEKDYNDDELIS
jgi:hypothetical protein